MPYGVAPQYVRVPSVLWERKTRVAGLRRTWLCRVVPTCRAVPLHWSEIQWFSPFAASQKPLESPY